MQPNTSPARCLSAAYAQAARISWAFLGWNAGRWRRRGRDRSSASRALPAKEEKRLRAKAAHSVAGEGKGTEG